jgi:hypothetical protein
VAVRCFRQRSHLYRDSRCLVGFLKPDLIGSGTLLPGARSVCPPTKGPLSGGLRNCRDILALLQGRTPMKHALSITVSALIFAVVSATAQAAPITSLSAGIATDANAANITPVHYRHWHRHHHYGYHGYGSASYWNYYRVDWPGRGTDEESTR